MTQILISALICAVIGIIVIICANRILKRSQEQMQKNTEENFARLSAQALEQQRSSIREENRHDMDLLLTPLQNRIEAFNHELREMNSNNVDSRQALVGQIDMLMRVNATMRDEASKLSQALRGNAKVRGDWGENILVTMLEAAGMQEGREFASQQTKDRFGETLKDVDGRLRRPDVVLSMPGERKIIIDSKVSLNAYLDYMEAESDEERRQLAAGIVSSVRKHLKEIEKANYTAVVEGSCELVVMFMPIEAAYFIALENDRNLVHEAYKVNVMLATPTHLFSILELVNRLWKQDAHNRNAEEIGKIAGELYDKIVDFAKRFEEVGRMIDKSAEEYKKTRNAVYYGKKSVAALAEKVKDMGALTSKSLNIPTTEE